jgi:anti-anti-sigma factor
LDAEASPLLDREILALEASGSKKVVINLQRATYISSSGLRVILIHSRKLHQAGGDIKLCCLEPRLQRVMSIAGLDSVLAIFPQETDASDAFAGGPTAAGQLRSAATPAGATPQRSGGGDLDTESRS